MSYQMVSPSQRRVPLGTFSSAPSVNTRPAGLPTYVSLPLSCPSWPLVHIFRFSADPVGILLLK
jgi:hypothetical protein